MNRLLSTIAVALALLTAPLALATVPAYADDTSASKTAACQGIGLTDASGDGCDKSAGQQVSKVIATIVNLLSVIVGTAAVIMIIVSGLKYVTSGGDSNKVSSAKTSLVYAIVGLVVVALAQFIVHFVLNNV
jgi:hypothetical protein